MTAPCYAAVLLGAASEANHAETSRPTQCPRPEILLLSSFSSSISSSHEHLNPTHILPSTSPTAPRRETEDEAALAWRCMHAQTMRTCKRQSSSAPILLLHPREATFASFVINTSYHTHDLRPGLGYQSRSLARSATATASTMMHSSHTFTKS
ncbi:hypothetical protein IE81DRAFT_168826 [Ceraceosorus guamensis]|uniref:Uncharacterized protein n=1 Tax=Ceraceosorus guamensis TaxID=1522189 RepID=A0A316VVH5_9BASI|nr:hypothetical protein IE81DRAFT_168826 [Ceraceosorus guamensis]PWN41606.1 hypothetical protein IE81DRAFT_168826 [Ceraceosorus guamensis]